VSCGSPTACIAVGGSGWRVDRWDGTSWSIESVAQAGAASAALSGVSCTSPTACTVVGATSSGPLAERWDGTSWSMQPTAAALPASLMSVSCASLTACTAVGGISSDQRLPATVAEGWNGASWSIQPTPTPTPDPAGTTPLYLTDVSCASLTACIAVGGYVDQSAALVERWDGTSWSIQPTPSPAGGVRGIFLSDVSCASPMACTLVGSYTPVNGIRVMLIERWDGIG
jgi:hypothetical protein